MKKITFIALSALCALTLFAAPGNAGTVSFNFKIPAIPWPPQISDVVSSAALPGAADFKVVAKITAQLQQTPTCDKANQADCVSSDWYLKPSPGVTPNPPAIKSAKVYYYLNDQSASAASVVMAEDPASGANKWKATVPMPAGAANGDSITYYIVAIDSRGNVASQVPDTGSVNSSCPSSPASWNAVFATPATNSCTQATSYTQCNVFVAGAPSCGTSYTLNDKNGDVCGEPDGNGNQTVVSVPKTDITGFSAAADKDYLCLNMGLGAVPPDANDPSPIEGYLAIIFNPDIYDDNPADFQIKNAYAITYAPEVTATDPTLVRVLWDANCITDPNTANILDCKLIYVTGTDTKLQVGYNNGLKFIVKRSGTGNPLPVSYSLVGNTNKLSYLVGLTGEINLSGANAFWIADLTPGLSFYQKNQVTPVLQEDIFPPAPPPLNPTKCSIDGTGGTSSLCYHLPIPPKNTCKLSWNESIDAGIVTEYRVYKSTTQSYVDGVTPRIATVPKATAPYNHLDTIPQNMLDGTKYYYFVSSYAAGNSDPAKRESTAAAINANNTSCTVVDSLPPAAPTITKAETPPGNEKKCKLNFTLPAADASLKSFYIKKDGVPVNLTNQMGAAPGETSFSWPDPDVLELNKAYTYTVTAVDLRDNTTESAPATCIPQDFKAPSGVTGAIVYNTCGGPPDVHVEWPPSSEDDLAGYFVYWCKMSNPAIDCRTAASFTKSDEIMLPEDTLSREFLPSDTNPPIEYDTDYCFYIDPCDNCDTAGTCPANGGKPNCGGFPSGGADAKTFVKCLNIVSCVDTGVPAFPNNVAATAPAEGRKCKITWEPNYRNSDSSPFEGSPAPLPKDILGYKIMRNTVADVPTPVQAAPVGVVAIPAAAASGSEFIDKTVVNGQKYYYTVYAFDGSGNFSANGSGGTSAEVPCTPKRTAPPATPVMGTLDYSQISCTPEWAAVSDPDSITYNIYKCAGGAAVCNASNKFAADADCVMEADGLSCTDNTLNTDQEYTFCVTASDPTPNESSVYPTSGRTNCASCTPSARPKPVTGVTVTAGAASCEALSTKIYWTNSTDYDQISGGVNIYRCADSACSTKTKAKACASLLASSDKVKNIGFANQLTLDAEPDGTWYYGVTYQKDCSDSTTESFLTGDTIGGPSTVMLYALDCGCAGGNCVEISSCVSGKCSPLTELDASEYVSGNGLALDKQVGRAVPKPGVPVYMLKNDGTYVAGPVSTDADGNVRLILSTTETPVDLNGRYQVVIKVGGADKAGIPCTDPSLLGAFKTTLGSDCGIQVIKNLTIKKGTPVKITLPSIPKGGQGRSEIGNINCDNVVDMKDYTLFRKSFSDVAITGPADPRAAADVNQDGVVDMKDFTIFKKNFNKCVSGSFDADGNCTSAAPSKVTGLCK